MAIVTTNRAGAIHRKPFAWSFSRLKNFETCPKRHWHIDLLPKGHPDKCVEPPGQALDWGTRVHDVLAARCGPDRVPIPQDVAASMPCAELWAQKVLGTGTGEILVEQSLALTKNFTSTGNFDSDVWLRVKGDFIRVIDDVALAADWKTGRILEDSVQLALTAACIFAKYPQVKAVRSSYIWLKEDAESSENFFREDMPHVWRSVWPRIEAMEQAYLNTNYPPTPSGICARFCAVKQCPHNGKTSR